MAKLAISLKSARTNKNLSRKEVADLLGVSEPALIKWEQDWDKGKRKVKLDVVLALADIYGIDIDDFNLRP